MKVFMAVESGIIPIDSKIWEQTLKQGHSISGIYDYSNDRIVVACHNDHNEYEKVTGPCGRHHSMRSLNALAINEWGLNAPLEYSDSIPDTVDFDIEFRGGNWVATIPHKIAQHLPGVVGYDSQNAKMSWADYMEPHEIVQSLDNMRGWKGFFFDGYYKIAKAAEMTSSEVYEPMYKNLSISEPQNVAIVLRPRRSKGRYRKDFGLCHADIGFNEGDICKNGQVFFNPSSMSFDVRF